MTLPGLKEIILILIAIPMLIASPVFGLESFPEKVTDEVTLAGDLLLSTTARVDAGAVLVLDAGCRIKASPGASIEVRGKLVIRGNGERTGGHFFPRQGDLGRDHLLPGRRREDSAPGAVGGKSRHRDDRLQGQYRQYNCDRCREGDPPDQGSQLQRLWMYPEKQQDRPGG